MLNININTPKNQILLECKQSLVKVLFAMGFNNTKKNRTRFGIESKKYVKEVFVMAYEAVKTCGK